MTANTVAWQWYRGNSEIVGATTGPGTLMSSYTPTTGDIGSVLRSYCHVRRRRGRRQDSPGRFCPCCPSSSRGRTSHRRSPTRTWVCLNVQTAQTREVAENTPAGTNIGAPVVASDPDVLTYSLSSTNNGYGCGVVRHQPGDRSADDEGLHWTSRLRTPTYDSNGNGNRSLRGYRLRQR